MDFDFLVGRWDITHHRLLKPLTGSTEWDEFPATTVARTFFDGAVSIDEISAPAREFSGLSLRLFAPQTEEWTVYWVNSRYGLLQAPVHGKWVDGVSRLFGDDEHDGQPVRATYQWSDVTDATARWEQAFSTDGGQTWETNWIMNFARTSHTPDGPREDGFLPKLTDGFDFLPGRWSVRNRTLKSRLTGETEWNEFEASCVAFSHFNGGISIDEHTFSRGDRGMSVRLYDVAAGEWVIYWVSSRDGLLGRPVRGGFENGVGEFYGDDEHDGRPVRVRFFWNGITEGSAHWEQAFSTDDGQTWETNWHMDLTRQA
jgi:hypothetical protein